MFKIVPKTCWAQLVPLLSTTSRSSALSWALCPIIFGSIVFKLGAKTSDGHQCWALSLDAALRRFSSPRTKLLAARCECLHLIKINCLALWLDESAHTCTRSELRGASCEDCMEIRLYARFLKAHSHSMSGGSFWARFNCVLSFSWVLMLFLNRWRASVIPYSVTAHPTAIQKQHWHSREAIEPPLIDCECEWAFRCCLHESGLTFNPDRNVKSIRVYMENGFGDWNFNTKMANDVNIIAVVFFSALSALINLSMCTKLLVLKKVILRKRKVAMLSYLVAFSFRNKFRFVFIWDPSQISIWIEISIRNEIRIELDPDRVVTHSGLM
jgi:hypothetical protein